MGIDFVASQPSKIASVSCSLGLAELMPIAPGGRPLKAVIKASDFQQWVDHIAELRELLVRTSPNYKLSLNEDQRVLEIRADSPRISPGHLANAAGRFLRGVSQQFPATIGRSRGVPSEMERELNDVTSEWNKARRARTRRLKLERSKRNATSAQIA